MRTDVFCEGSSYLNALWGKTDPFHPLMFHMIDVGNGIGFLLEHTPYRAVGQKLSTSLGVPYKTLLPWAQFLASMHDIGKCHPLFQGKASLEIVQCLVKKELIPPRFSSGFRHEAFSSEWVRPYLQNKHGWHRKATRTIGYCLHGHHGNFFSARNGEEPTPIHTFWESLRIEVTNRLFSLFHPEPWAPQDFPQHSNAGMLFSGMIILSDWVVSNPELFLMIGDESLSDGQDWEEYGERSKILVEKAFSSIGIQHRLTWPKKPSFQSIWKGLDFPQLRPIQQTIQNMIDEERMPPGIAIIEAPMGEGKTEAALHLASHWMNQKDLSGLYIALPTAATSNQMYSRVNDWISHNDPDALAKVRLIHGMAWMVDDHTPVQSPSVDGEDLLERRRIHDWFQPRKRSLLGSYGVGTVDQVMMGALYVKHGFLRLLGLTGKVLLIDEVHAYDAYMSCIIQRLLHWCGSLEIPVILLSATIPSGKKQSLLSSYIQGLASNQESEQVHLHEMDYPLITLAHPQNQEPPIIQEIPVSASSKTQTFSLHTHPALGSHEQMAQQVSDRLKQGGVFCCILNTVASAQQLYLRLKETVDSDCVLILFHGRFLAGRRKEIEERVLSLFDKSSLLSPDHPNHHTRPQKAVLVATQVVEQSLDVDFDEMYSEITPIDLLLQRMGRLHRHTRKNRPTGNSGVFHLWTPSPQDEDFGNSGFVYQPLILWKTLWSLHGKTAIHLPNEIRPLVESVYSDPEKIPESFIDAKKLEKAREKMVATLAEEEIEAMKPSFQSLLLKSSASHRSVKPLGSRKTKKG